MTDSDFEEGALHRVSYVRPVKLFTANESLIEGKVATLKSEALIRVIEAVVQLFRVR